MESVAIFITSIFSSTVADCLVLIYQKLLNATRLKYGDESTRQIGLREPRLSKLDRCFTFAVHYSVMSSKETISTRYASYNLDHFGMVAGMVDELGIVETIDEHIKHLNADFGMKLIVADSALFNEKSLVKLGRFPWVSRVPETITAAKELIKATAEALMQTGQEQAHCSLGVVYAEIKQRWLVVYSEAARHRVQKTLCRQHLKQSSAKLKAFDQLCRQSFNCTEDAQAALAKFEKGLGLMFVGESQIKQIPQYKDKGRPRKDQTPDSYIYQIEGQLGISTDDMNCLAKTKLNLEAV